MLTLYFTPGASSMAPHIALHEVGASFESRPISLAKRENLAPAYLPVNREGKVPPLLIDSCHLTEAPPLLFIWLDVTPRQTCCPSATPRRKLRPSPGCRLSPRPCIQPAPVVSTMP